MEKTKRIQLSSNEAFIKNQSEFNQTVRNQITELITIFNQIGIGEFDLSELENVWTGRPEPIVSRKSSQKFKDVEINGLKLNPDKVFEMVGLNASAFIAKYIEFQKFIREEVAQISVSKGTGISFDPKFFTLENSIVEINSSYQSQWNDKNAHVFTNNETQAAVFTTLKNICEGINKLKSIEKLKVKQGFKNLLGEDSEFAEMIKWNGNSYEPNTKFIINL